MKTLAILAAVTVPLIAQPEESKVAKPASPSLSNVVAAPHVDFKARFGHFDGCFVLKSLDDGWTLRFNDQRAAKRFAPCSTFKIFNAMAGLEVGALTGPDHEMKWDGTKQTRKECERDHTLATAIRDSVVWYFQRVAEGVGAKRMQAFLDQCDYGNRDMSGGLTKFWLQTSLEISADEQMGFMEQMYAGKLPFKSATVDTVKRLIEYRQSNDWIFSGKTGTGGEGGKSDKAILGWYVGHVKKGDRQFIFAINISGDNAMGRTARKIAANILRDLGLIEFPGEFD
ncbi:MAG: class D beta-lactamase [Planctomycetes bacterium]|nr:class D beta-lactamase [Planctomycetota bacterium]